MKQADEIGSVISRKPTSMLKSNHDKRVVSRIEGEEYLDI